MPCRDDKKLFEFLILESAQAGLSWLTILRKRENYRAAFADFDVKKVAAFVDADAASTAMQAVAPIGVKLLKHEKLVFTDVAS